MTFGAAGRQRQHAVAAIQGLNGGLFVHAEDGSMTGRIEVEADDIGRLALEVGIVGGHVALQPMRLEIGLAPDAVDEGLADAELSERVCDRTNAWSRRGACAGWRRGSGRAAGGEFLRSLSGAMRFQPIETVFEKALLPLANGWRGGVQLCPRSPGRTGRLPAAGESWRAKQNRQAAIASGQSLRSRFAAPASEPVAHLERACRKDVCPMYKVTLGQSTSWPAGSGA